MNYEHRRLKLIARAVAQHMPGTDNVKVFDIGYARQLNTFLLEAPRYHITGLDKRKNEEGVHYHEEVQGDATEDLSRLGKFDVIIAGAFIEHIENPYQLLRNIHAVAHDNTLLVISTPNPVGIPTLFFELIASKRRFYSAAHLYYMAPRWVQKMLKDTGWNVIQTIGVGAYFLKFWLPVPYTMSYDIIYVSKKREGPCAA